MSATYQIEDLIFCRLAFLLVNAVCPNIRETLYQPPRRRLNVAIGFQRVIVVRYRWLGLAELDAFPLAGARQMTFDGDATDRTSRPNVAVFLQEIGLLQLGRENAMLELSIKFEEYVT